MTFNQAIALWTGGAAAADAVISIGLYINLRRKKVSGRREKANPAHRRSRAPA